MTRLCVYWIACYLTAIAVAAAEPPAEPPAESPAESPVEQKADPAPIVDPAMDSLRSLAAELLRSHLPTHYVNEKEWGKKKQVFDGVRLRREGIKLETERKWKTVNDGTWKRYEIDLLDSKDAIPLAVDRLESTTDQRCVIEMSCEAPLHVFGRLAIWERGVQIISLNADANSRVRLRVTADVGIKFDVAKLPPDVMLDPKVTAAQLELLDFRLNRLSQLHGPLAKHLGEGLRDVVDDRIADTNRTLVEKLNRQIERKKDRLRFSFTDSLAKQWTKWTSRGVSH